jgi:hypothetical protein
VIKDRPLHVVTVHGPIPAKPIAPVKVVHVGTRLYYLGRSGTVVRINYHPRWGDFFALSAEDDGAYELISASGADGQFEVLPAS